VTPLSGALAGGAGIVGVVSSARAKTCYHVFERRGAKRVDGVGAVCGLLVGVLAGNFKLGDASGLVDVELTGQGQGAVVAVLESAEAAEVFGGPAVEDAAVILGVVEGGQSVEVAPVTDTGSHGGEGDRVVYVATSDVTFVPKSPVRVVVQGGVATLSTKVGVVVVLASAVLEGEEPRATL